MTPIARPDAVLGLLAAHVWESTLVALAAIVLCLLLKNYRAEVRSAILTIASVKFLIPFALLAIAGTWIPWPPAPTSAPAPPNAALSAVPIEGAPAGSGASIATIPATAGDPTLVESASTVLILVWIAGSAVLLARRILSVAAAARLRRRTHPLAHGREAGAFARLIGRGRYPRVELRASSDCDSPCVLGVWRPALLWPDGIGDELSDAQLDAIVSHELAHVRRRDNLAAAGHALVEILFWFHPLVWWVGARLAEARERACDEDVLAAGAVRDDYADGIIKICERSLAVPAAGAVGIAGSPLLRRIEAIMMTHTPRPLGNIRRAILVAAALSLVAVPLGAGALNKPPLQGDETGRHSTIATDEPLAAEASTSARQAGSGRIAGTVTDQMGGFMPGVTVSARSVAGVDHQTTTDDSGRYAIVVPAGEYSVRFTHPGFKTRMAVQVRVRSNEDAPANVQLEIGSVSEAVTLTAQVGAPPAVDTAALLARESELLQQLGQTPDDVAIHRELASVYYRLERYADSQVAMQRAAALTGRAAAEPGRDYVVTLPRGGVIGEPRKIRDVKPIYPAIAQTARVSGVVIIEAKIAEDGTVRDARVLRSVPLLDEAALGAVRQWVFTPTRLNGVPIEVVITATVNFTLRESGGRR